MVTGRPGVAMVTSGPGATNIVTPLANAYMDSIADRRDHRAGGDGLHRHRRLPGVRHHRRHDGHHQAQLAGHRRRRTSRGWSPRRSTRHDRAPGPGARRRAEGRLNAQMDWYWPDSVDDLDLPGYQPADRGRPELVVEAARPDPRRRAPGDLRGRRDPRRPRRPGAPGARRAHRHPGRHHPDGPRRLPRHATRSASGCRACTATTPRSPRCSEPTC